ncbi:hypothetical protein G7Y79_00005g017710 [Physcia stellaris]|nr:hypothetical protein G7Y79_00005g017710 [Physcia stellaris]
MRTTFHSHVGLLSVLIAPNLVLAQTSDVDPTDISNWPACAQKCIPQGYGPPANCGSLSNLDCICDNPEFTLAIADCEQSTCLLSERVEITKLSNALCAPKGGLGPAVNSAISSYFATYSERLPSTPVIVAPTPAPQLGNVSDLNNYPPCDQQCAYAARAAVKSCNTKEKSCICAPEFRGMTAACVAYNCTIPEEKRTNDLDDQFCGPFYVSNAVLSASVASAIASATSSAHAAARASASSTAVGGSSNSTNGTITGAPGGPTPSSFTGGAGRVSEWSLGVAGAVVVGAVGLFAVGL